MTFSADHLTKIRKQLGITKAEAARKLNMSAMGYGRYETGEREPSYQTVSFIAQTFGTSTDYLYGITDDSNARSITIEQDHNPELFDLIQICLNNEDSAKRLLAYINVIDKKK